MMSDAELGELAQDIQENGLQQPIIILRDNEGETRGESGPYPTFLLDGRNRLEALKRLGVTDPSKTPGGALYSQKVRVIDLHMQTTLGRGAAWEAVLDPVTFVLSMNVKRRHLTREQKRAILAASIKAEPALSDRQHAKRAGVSDKTAGAVRRELESTAEIPQSDSRVSGDGRTRRKPEKKNDYFDSAAEQADVMAMADAADEQFEDALATCRAEGDMSRENVAAHCSNPADLSDDEFEEMLGRVPLPADTTEYGGWDYGDGGANRTVLARNWKCPVDVRAMGQQRDTGATRWYVELDCVELSAVEVRAVAATLLEAADELERRQAQ